MPPRTSSPTVPLPRSWSSFVRSGVLHAISLATTALTVAWSKAAERRSPQRQRAEIDRLRAEIVHVTSALGDQRDQSALNAA